jgi:hypothetical protein
MGVVSGIVMPFQFGTNWSRFSDVTANVLSPLFRGWKRADQKVGPATLNWALACCGIAWSFTDKSGHDQNPAGNMMRYAKIYPARGIKTSLPVREGETESAVRSSWLVIKTEGNLQAWARRHGRWCLIGVLAAIGVVSLWRPLVHEDIAERWFSWPNLLLLSPVPIITALLA